jgi:predicted secreted protein
LSSATAAFGVTVTYEGTTIGEVFDVPNVNFKKDRIDVTHHASTGGYEESILSKVIRSEEITMRCNSVPGDAGQILLKAAQAAGTAGTVVITFPDGATVTGEAYVMAFSYLGEMEDRIIFDFTIKWTGAVTASVTLATAPSALAITTGTLYPSFAAGTYDYVVTSTGDTGTLTLTFATSTAALYREGVYVQALVTETPSGSISFGADGTVTDLQIIVSETGKSNRIYNIRVANAAA